MPGVPAKRWSDVSEELGIADDNEDYIRNPEEWEAQRRTCSARNFDETWPN